MSFLEGFYSLVWNCKIKGVNSVSDIINLEATPIQRNRRDVAVELLKLSISWNRTKKDYTEDELMALYNKFYANACTIEDMPISEMEKYL